MPKNVLVHSRLQIELVMYLLPCQASAMELKKLVLFMKSGTYNHSGGVVVSPCEVKMEAYEEDVMVCKYFRCHDKTDMCALPWIGSKSCGYGKLIYLHQ